ncbi:MAG: carbohydrate kinase [Rhodobacteraceae bacterium]|nr:MAG: carbohydrate kinase [Paracoccaceae bacterium]
MTILVCGEALCDVFPGAETPEGLTLDARLGGAAFNVAVALARLDRRAAFVGGVSTDAPGARLMRALGAEGVDTRWAARKDAPTTLAMVAVAPDGAARYFFHGAGAADRLLAPGDLPPLDRDVEAVCLGCFPLVAAPVGDTLLGFAQAAAGGPVVSLDPNLRLPAFPDRALWRARIGAVAALADIVKISVEDLDALSPGVAPADAAAAFLAAGASLVVVTEGAAGAAAWTAAAHAAAAAPPVSVVDTVGAGDSFLAALLCVLGETGALRRDALRAAGPDALRRWLGFATRAAAETCRRRGADPARRADLPRV